jgi:hypothetical protein
MGDMYIQRRTDEELKKMINSTQNNITWTCVVFIIAYLFLIFTKKMTLELTIFGLVVVFFIVIANTIESNHCETLLEIRNRAKYKMQELRNSGKLRRRRLP